MNAQNWSLILMEDHKVRLFENMALRRIFVPKRDEVKEGWKKLYYEEFHNVCSPPSMIRTDRAQLLDITIYSLCVNESHDFSFR
jgi:hypothetical protein